VCTRNHIKTILFFLYSVPLQGNDSSAAKYNADEAAGNVGAVLDALDFGEFEITVPLSQTRPKPTRDDKNDNATVPASQISSQFHGGATLPRDLSIKHSALYQSYDLNFAWARQLYHPPKSPEDLFASSLVCYSCQGEAWKSSFRCAYFALRCGALDTLYLRTRDFTVLWRSDPRSPSASNRAREASAAIWQRPCEAWVYPTTRPLRKALTDADVTFSLPLDRTGKVAAGDLNEEGTTSAKASRSRDAQIGDALLAHVDGHLEVAGLFEVLTCGDVALGPAPMVLSPSAFQGATLTAAAVTFAGPVTVAAGAESRSQDRIEVTGTFLPCAIRKQCDALAQLAREKGHRCTFSAKYKTFVDTTAFSRYVTPSISMPFEDMRQFAQCFRMFLAFFVFFFRDCIRENMSGALAGDSNDEASMGVIAKVHFDTAEKRGFEVHFE
jgi:hypothetical protein